MNATWTRIGITALALLGAMMAGCSGSKSAASQSMHSGHGIVYYCDGAGGGGLMNWGPGVRKGLTRAGFNGTFEEFDWETGLGVVADQVESVKAKRAKAAELASKIAEYKSAYPNGPVHLMGLSAGTAIAAFTLEALPPETQVDTVVLLSGSLASDHNLTRALQHVRGEFYVTTSPHDGILTTAVPTLGSADREMVGDRVVGVHGVEVPPDAGPAARRLYSKVVLIAWDASDEQFGDYGGHTDTTKPAFVQHVIAPLIIREGPRNVRIHQNGTAGTYGASSN